MHATGRHPSVVHVGGMVHPAGVSLALGGNALVHPSVTVSPEKDWSNCSPPRICVESAVLCDSNFTPGEPRLLTALARDAANPLVWVAFALAPADGGLHEVGQNRRLGGAIHIGIAAVRAEAGGDREVVG